MFVPLINSAAGLGPADVARIVLESVGAILPRPPWPGGRAEIPRQRRILVLGLGSRPSVHRQTAVDVQRFARDVAAEIGRQKRHGRGDIGAAAESRERYLIAQRLNL